MGWGFASVVTLSIAIMHMPFAIDRVKHVEAMREHFDPDDERLARVATIADTAKQGPWPTARRAWSAGLQPRGSKVTHHLVLQDDVALCRNFVAQATTALAACSSAPVSFYANRKVVDEARESGVHWAVISDGIWGQAPCLPVGLIQPFLSWCDEFIAADFKHDDSRLTLFCLVHKLPVWCTVPSLVQHLEPKRSLLGNANSNRVARWFERDPGPVNWADTTFVRDSSSLAAYANRYKTWFLKPLEARPL